MTTYTLPPALRSQLAEDVALTIERFTPKVLSPGDWVALRGPACDLAARTIPPTKDSATQVISVLCRFLAWAGPVAGTYDLDVVLKDRMVERFIVALDGEVSVHGRRGYRTALRYCLRAVAGEIARKPRGARPETVAPYTAEQMEKLAQAAENRPELKRILDNSHLAGRSQAPEGRGTTRSGRPVAGDGAPIWGPVELERVRTAALKVGVRLMISQVVATWSHNQLSDPVSVVQMVRDRRMSYKNFDDTLPHLPAPTEDEVRHYLRGA